VPHEFLSDGWFDEVHRIREKYEDQAPPLPYKVRMNQVITGAPFASDPVKIYLDTTSGKMVMERGEVEAPEVTLTTDWATARAIIVEQDQAAAMQAFMSGKIKVQGDMTKLMMMNAAPPDELAKTVAAEIKAITS
jgi:putative sterol carrier protein